MTQVRFLKKAALLSGAALLSFAATAHAGFEWKGPLEAPHAAEAPAMPGAEMAPDQELAPVSSWTNDMAAPPPVNNAAPSSVNNAPVTAAPVSAEPMQAAPAPAPEQHAMATVPPSAMPDAQGDVLAGFGSNLPLVIALQQVVPAGYQYSFSGGVNPGVSVSWQGGKSWQQVLGEMLSPAGLTYRIQGNAVVISNWTGGAQPASYGAAATPAADDNAADSMMSPAPDDTSSGMAPISITSQPPANTAPETAPWQAAPADKPQTADIRREKPSSLLERLGWKRADSSEVPATENVAVPAQTAAPAQQAAAPAEDMTAPPVALASAAQPPAQPAQAAPAMTNGSWAAHKGDTLRDVLKNWSDKAGVEMYWSIDYDYRLAGDVGYTGSYDEAVGGLLETFSTTRPQPYGQLHQSSSGPRVLVVKSYDVTR